MLSYHKYCKRCFFLVLLLISHFVIAQDQLSISLKDPIYNLLEISSIKGALSRYSYVHPYNKDMVVDYISQVIEKKQKMTDYEFYLLASLYQPPEKQKNPKVLISEESDFRLMISENFSYHSDNLIKGELIGSLAPKMSYNINLSIFLDKVEPEAFSPYDFTKKWDGAHMDPSGSGAFSSGANNYFSLNVSSQPEFSINLFNSKMNFKLARIRHEWGVGDGSLSLSGTARPIEAYEGNFWIGSWAKVHFLTGSLGNWRKKFVDQKMFAIHRLELFPFNWLYLSVWESIVFAKRMELSYFNPIMPYWVAQSITGDLDNQVLGGDVAITIYPYIRIYFSLFLDEIVTSSFDDFFQNPKNQYALQAGIKMPIPGLPFTLLTFQYTKIEPYCYTHYPQKLSQYDVDININYSHDEENIGYHLPPNSDEFLVKIFSYPLSGLAITAQYQLIRHGSGNYNNGQIEGDINIWLDYDNLSAYPPKDFLDDGIYEWINIFKLHIAYTLPFLRSTVWGEYSYVNVKNYSNIQGNDMVKHLLGLGLRINIL